MPEPQLRIPTTSTGAASVYVNYFEIAHNRHEFLFELGQFRPGRADGDGTLAIHTRLTLFPACAKMLSDMLSRGIARHEEEHGPIADFSATETPFDTVLYSAADHRERTRSPEGDASRMGAEAPKAPSSAEDS